MTLTKINPKSIGVKMSEYKLKTSPYNPALFFTELVYPDGIPDKETLESLQAWADEYDREVVRELKKHFEGGQDGYQPP